MKALSQLDLPWIRWKCALQNRKVGNGSPGNSGSALSGTADSVNVPANSGSALDLVSQLINEGEQGWEQGAWFEAENSLRKCVSLVKSARLPKVWQGLASAMLAELSEAQHRNAEATQLYYTATEIMDQNECHPWAELRYKCHNNLACLLKRSEQAESSEKSYIQSIRVLENNAANNWEHRSTLYHNLGALYHDNGYYREAVDMHQQSMAYLHKMRAVAPKLQADGNRALALALLFCGKQAEALDQMTSARKLLGGADTETAAIITELLVMEASARLQRNDLKGAESFCLEAIDTCQKFSARRPTGPTAQMLPMLYTNLGCVYARAGQLTASRDMLEDSHLLLLGMWNSSTEALRDSHYNLWLICQKLEDHASADRHETKLRQLDATLAAKRRLPEGTTAHRELVSHQPVPQNQRAGMALTFGLRTSLAIPVLPAVFG